MRPDSLAVAALLVGVLASTVGSIVTLLTETLVGVSPVAAVGLLVAALVGAIVFGARSRSRLTNPYW